MAKNDTEKVQAEAIKEVVSEPTKSIEVLKEELQISTPVFEAVKLSKRWAEGKEVTKAEFEAAVEAWLGSPIDKGRSV